MPKVPQVLKIEPPEALSFKGPFTEVVVSTLTLRNPSDTKVAFKVKTTAPKRYCVRPNSGVLAKDELVTVMVMLQPFEFDPAEKTKHKFMIQSLIMEGGIDEKEVWKDTDPDKLMDTKLRVVFDPDSAAPTAGAQPFVPPQNDLDASGEPMQITPQKANVKTANINIEDEYSKAKAENANLLQEIATLKEDRERLRRIAMTDTISSSTSQKQQPSQLPTGVNLLLVDKTNIILLLVLFIAAFTSGLFLSNALIGR